MTVPNDSLDLDMVLLDFPAAYARTHWTRWVLLQCLLLNEDLIAPRQSPLIRLQLSFSAAFETKEGSHNPDSAGLPEGQFQVTLQLPAKKWCTKCD